MAQTDIPVNEKLVPMVRELMGWQDRLIQCARELVDKADAGAKFTEIDAHIGYMDILQRHRRSVLWEYSRAGGHVIDVNNFGAHIAKEYDI